MSRTPTVTWHSNWLRFLSLGVLALDLCYAQATCREYSQTPPYKGSLSEEDCHIRDVIPGWQRPNALSKVYSYRAGASGLLKARISRSQPGSTLRLLLTTQGYSTLAGPAADLSVPVSEGESYRVIVLGSHETEGGFFEVEVRLGEQGLPSPPTPTCSERPIQPNDSVQGSAAKERCAYPLGITQGGSLRVYFNGKGAEIALVRDREAVCEGTGSCEVEPGDYLVTVSRTSAHPVPFQFRTDFTVCPLTFKTALPGSTTGKFEPGCAKHTYRFMAPGGGVRLEALSPSIKPRLLLSECGKVVPLLERVGLIQTELDKGDYCLEVNSSEGVSAGYDLKLRGECPWDPIGPAETKTRSLSAEDCRAFEYFPGLADLSRSYLHKLNVERPSNCTLDLVSQAFKPALRVFACGGPSSTGPGDLVAGDRFGRNWRLEAGLNCLLASSADSRLGPYTLRTICREAPCPEREISVGQVVDARLSEADCRERDVLRVSSAPWRVQKYRLVLERDTQLAIRLGAEFPVLLSLYDSAGTPRFEEPASLGRAAEIKTELRGEHTILVRATSSVLGAYRLEVVSPCVSTNIGLNDEKAGLLSASSCPSPCGGSADQFTLSTDRLRTVSVEFASRNFAPRVCVLSGNTEIGRGAGDAATPARFTGIFKPGEYKIFAGAGLAPIGAYVIRTQSCQIEELQLGSSVTGRLTRDDCVAGPSYVKQYRVQVPRPGTLRLRLSSNHFIPVLVVHDSALRQQAGVVEDTNRARVVEFSRAVRPGDYVIYARTRNQSEGTFTLSVELR